ncbi:MAG: helix-turn-helix domain-containing protein [Oscillospiraceae bacterium]
MYQDMHVTNSWEFTEPMAVKAIYKLFTEGDYAVNHRIIVPDKYFYIYTMEGVGTFVVDDDQLVVSANSLVVVNAKRGLHYHCSGPKWNFWLVEFKTAHPRLIPNKVYPLALGKTVLSQFAVALQEFKQEHIQSAAALFQFIYYASARLAEERQGKQTRRLLNAALAYMQENLRNFSVAELCRYLNVEERTLRNIFMRKLNTSPKKYFEYLRLEESKRYLETTTLPVSVIAAHMGFANSGHFSTAFRREYGETPKQYRLAFNDGVYLTK